ncbi:MAG: response regulator [Candidatus Aquilonibacter sp.]
MARVLVVDDDVNARLLLRTLLAHLGHDVFEAADGRQGLATAFEVEPHLIIIDLSMPEMNGPTFVRALRANARIGTTPVALYTASAIDAPTRDFMEIYGVATALPKPAEPRELLAAIEAALEQRH